MFVFTDERHRKKRVNLDIEEFFESRLNGNEPGFSGTGIYTPFYHNADYDIKGVEVLMKKFGLSAIMMRRLKNSLEYKNAASDFLEKNGYEISEWNLESLGIK